MLPKTFGSSPWFDDDELVKLEGTTLHRATVMQVHRCRLQTVPFLFPLLLCIGLSGIGEYIGGMNTLGVLFQKKSLQTLFNDKVKGLVEALLHVDESGRFVVFFSP